jgi:hypothetical protein
MFHFCHLCGICVNVYCFHLYCKLDYMFWLNWSSSGVSFVCLRNLLYCYDAHVQFICTKWWVMLESYIRYVFMFSPSMHV